MQQIFRIFPWASRIALLIGIACVLAGMLYVHPLIYSAGVVKYPTQAIAIARRECATISPGFGGDGHWLWWRAELSKDAFDGQYVWRAGYATRRWGCSVVVDARNGALIDADTFFEDLY